MKRVLVFAMVLILIPTGVVLAEEEKPVGEVFDLGRVVVTAQGEEANPATTVSTVTAEDIYSRGVRNVAEALEQVPGVIVQMGSKGHATIKLRGYSQEDVKVLIDGVPAHEAYFGSLDLDQIPIDSVAKIKVIKGASSVLYGSNTMGGVINIITKKGGKEPRTDLTASFGEDATQNYIVNHGAGVGHFNYWVTGSYRTTDGFRLSDDFDPNNDRTGLGTSFNEDGGLRDLSDFTKKTLNAKIGYDNQESTEVYLSLDYHDNEKGCPTEFERYWKFDEWKQWHLNLVGEHDFTDAFTMKARLFYVDHEDTLKDVSWDADHTTSRKWFEESSFDDYSMGGELQSYMDFGQWSLIKVGVNYLKDNHKQQDFLDEACTGVQRGWDSPGFLPQEEYEASTYTFAVEDELSPIDKLTLTLGVSYNLYDPTKAYDQPTPDQIDSIDPQAGLVFDATDTLALHASVGKKTRFPQLIELYSEQAGGNPDLDPQQTMAYEIGASQLFPGVMSASVALFYNDIEDRIERRDNPDTGDREYVNMGESDITGVELGFDLLTWEQLKAGMNYTYLDAQEKENSDSEERDSENTPKHKLNLDLGYRFDFGLSTFVQASYTADQIEYTRDGDIYDVDDYFLVHGKISQNLKNWIKIDSKVFFEIKNILDENYEEGSGPMPGRRFLAGVTLAF